MCFSSFIMLVDIHAHLDHERFKDDLDIVIENARKAGVKAIITSGVNKSTNRKALEIAEKYKDIVKCSLGIYPLDALAEELKKEPNTFVRDIENLDIDEELKFIMKNKDRIVAVGECGLDFNWTKSFEKEQKSNFQKVIKAVEKINKPIIVHSRKAELEAVEILESCKIKNIVMHCFNGSKKLIKRAVDNGWYFSIPPLIVRLQHFQMMAEIVDINQLLTETDCPYLSPYFGKRNEPAFVIETVKKIAEIKGMNEQEVKENIFKNYNDVFGPVV